MAIEVEPRMQIIPLGVQPTDGQVQPSLRLFIGLIGAGLKGTGGTVMMHGAEVTPVPRRLRAPRGEPGDGCLRGFWHGEFPRRQASARRLRERPRRPATQRHVHIQPHLTFTLARLERPPEERQHLLPHERLELRPVIIEVPVRPLDLVNQLTVEQPRDRFALLQLWPAQFGQLHVSASQSSGCCCCR